MLFVYFIISTIFGAFYAVLDGLWEARFEHPLFKKSGRSESFGESTHNWVIIIILSVTLSFGFYVLYVLWFEQSFGILWILGCVIIWGNVLDSLSQENILRRIKNGDEKLRRYQDKYLRFIVWFNA